MEVKFYIVVPVYKAELFLEHCYESVKLQTYQNWELILIDDGSPDKSGKICDEISESDKRVHVIHQSNKGQIAARIAGNKYIIKNRDIGSYVLYLDSDDTLDLHALSILYSLIKKDGSDIVYYGWQRVRSGKIYPDPNTPKNQFIGVTSDKKFIYKIVFSDMYYNSMCLKCISTALLNCDDYSQYYKIRHGEDLIQTIALLKDCNKITFTDATLYNYTVNEASVTQTIDYNKYEISSVVRSYVWDFLEKEDVWSKSDFESYARIMQSFLAKQLYKIAIAPIKIGRAKSLYADIRSDHYYSKILSYSTCSLIIALYKLKLDHSIIHICRFVYFLKQSNKHLRDFLSSL